MWISRFQAAEFHLISKKTTTDSLDCCLPLALFIRRRSRQGTGGVGVSRRDFVGGVPACLGGGFAVGRLLVLVGAAQD